MPPVPRITEKPIMNLVSSKNFVTANAVENILAAPKKVGVEVLLFPFSSLYSRLLLLFLLF